jgi:hypothetical protein
MQRWTVRHQPFDDGSEREPAGESPVMNRNQLKSPLGKFGVDRQSDFSQSRHVFHARPLLVDTSRFSGLGPPLLSERIKWGGSLRPASSGSLYHSYLVKDVA